MYADPKGNYPRERPRRVVKQLTDPGSEMYFENLDSSASVTVVSVWHDRVQTVERSLTSILSQENISAQFLIVDDGSTDGTTRAIRDVATRFPDRDIELVQQANKGFTRTLRRWTSEVNTQYFALHGAGDISAPTRLARQLRHAQATDAVVVGCGVGSVGSTGEQSELKALPRDAPRGGASPHRPPRPGTHGAALMHTEAFQAAGGYRSEFPYSQDADLWFRMSALGDFSGVPELLYWKYRGVGETVSSRTSTRFLQALYGELARQCEEDRVKGEADLVDRFGRDAVLFLRDTGRLRKRLLRSGMETEGMAAMRGLASGAGVSSRAEMPRLTSLLGRRLGRRP